MQFRVLGPLEADAGDGPINLGGPKQRAVLASLLVRANQVVPAETLIAEIWGDEPPEGARNTLQTDISNLRKVLGDDRVVRRAPGYVLSIDPLDVDAERFDALVRDAERALPVDPGVAVETLEDALALWRGPALADVADRVTLVAEAARLDELRLEAQEDRIEGLLAIGAAARAASEAELVVAEHPLRERPWSQLMLGLYRDGRQAEALGAFQRARELLADELGVDPSADLVRLHERILRHDPGLDLRGEPLRGYRLLEKIGEGPTGVVFRAIQPHTERDVAVKVVHERIAGDPGFVQRFDHDAQMAAALEHPYIVPMYDHWREPGRAYLVSRYMRGGSLRDREERGEPIDPVTADRIGGQIGAALAFAHSRGVVHGAIHAGNVLFDGDDNAYLANAPVGRGTGGSLDGDAADLASLLSSLGGSAERDAGVPAGADIEAAGPAQERNPYKGLRPFTEADANDFHGRAALVRFLLDELRSDERGSRFLAVVGPSGSGKSSLVRAGLLPALRAGGLGSFAQLFITDMFPGIHPMDELEAAVRRIAVLPASGLHERLASGSRGLLDAVDLVIPPGDEVVLAVDQFEELFTLTATDRERAAFLEAIRVATADPESRIRVIITLRADFYDRPLVAPRFGELLAARTVAVPPLTADEMEQAIRTPAERADVSLDHGVVAEMIADVAHQPGALPLLQYSLTEMFDRREHDHITVADYEAVGRIAGALSSRADRIVDEADGTERRAIRQVLLRLVTLGEGREDTRRRVPLRELDRLGIDQEALTRVLDTFGRHRIMTFDRDPASREPTVEIAHEALLAAWARLRTWIDGAREDLRRERRLADATAAWLAEGRDPSFLMRGARLERTEDWLSTTDVGVGHDELAFVRASAEQRDREAAAERERAQREVRNEARARTRLRALVAVFAIAAVVAGSLTLVATDQRGRASTAAVVAQARELASAANASLEDDPELAVLLAAEAVERSRAATGEPDVEATQALHRAILASRIVATVPDVRGPIATSPDGTIAAQREAGAIVLFDGSGSPISTIDAHGGEITSMAFSPDGRRLVTTGTDGRLRVWDPSNGTLDWERRGAGEAWGATLDARGALVTARWPAAGVVVVSDAATGRPIRTLRGLDESSLVAISPDGGRIALSVGENRGVVFGRIISLRGTGGGVRFDAPPWQGINGPLDWSPDGRFLSGSSYVWDATTGERIHTVWNHDGLVGSSDWSPDAGRLVTGGWDGVTNIWSFEPELRPSLTLTARDIGVVAVTFTPDGDRVITASDAVRIWDVRPLGNAERASLALPTTFDGQIAFTPDGALIVNHDGGEGLLRWTIDEPGGVPVSSTRVAPSTAFDVNPVDGSIVQSNDDGTHSVLGEDGARRSTIETGPIEWAADGEHLAATPGTRTVALVEPDGTEVWRMQLPIDVGVLEVGTDGLIAVSGKDADPAPMTLILDAEGSIVATLPSHAIGLRFGAPGRIATIDERTQITEWDIASGRPVHTYPEDGPFAFSPDGITMAVMRGDAVRLYDTTTHEVVLELPSPDDTPGTEFCFADQLAFDPSGTLLAVRSCDGVRVWSLDIDDLLTIAAANVTRTLTDEECRRYLHTDGCT